MSGCTPSIANQNESAQPNILIITIDNLGYGDFKVYNADSPIITPHIDKLASQGARLTDFYSASPTCSASRASFLTGRIPQRNTLDDQLRSIPGNYGIGLPQSEVIIPQVLKDHSTGYASGAFGKWNIGFAPGSRPTERGFDEYLGNASGNIDHYSHVYHGKHDLYHNLESINREGEYSTDLFADSAIDFIEEKTADAQPWFVYLPFDAPHVPGDYNIPPDEPNIFKAPDHAFEPYEFSPDEDDVNKRYSAVVTAIDFAVGRVMDTLDSLGIAGDTFVFFYSDNGANIDDVQERIMGAKFASNAPLRGGRPNLYEGAIRIPAFARWPGKIEEGSVISTRLWIPDLFTAIIRLAGAELPRDRFIDGKNPLAVLTGQTDVSPHATLFFEYRDHQALLWGDYKIVREDPEDPWILFNLREDISESMDLASERSDLVQKLERPFLMKRAEIVNYLERESGTLDPGKLPYRPY